MDVQQLFKNLKKEAECPLCLETVKNPKTLPCVSTSWQASPEDSYKQQSNARFARLPSKSL